MTVDEKDPHFWEQVVHYWPQYRAASIIAGVGWLIRTVFTNQKKLEVLEAEIAIREKARCKERDDIKEVKADVKEMNTALMNFFSNQK